MGDKPEQVTSLINLCTAKCVPNVFICLRDYENTPIKPARLEMEIRLLTSLAL
jgi:hypothetical protein